MSSGFRRWIWYEIPSNSSLSEDGLRECDKPTVDKVETRRAVLLDVIEGFTS